MTNVKYVERLSADQIVLFFKSQGFNYTNCQILEYRSSNSIYFKMMDINGLILLYKMCDTYVTSYNHDRISNESWMAYLTGLFADEYLQDNCFFRK